MRDWGLILQKPVVRNNPNPYLYSTVYSIQYTLLWEITLTPTYRLGICLCPLYPYLYEAIRVSYSMFIPWYRPSRMVQTVSVRPSVCLSVCLCVSLSVRVFTFEVPFNGIFAPTSQSRLSNIFRDSESLEKSNGKKWSHIWTFLFGSGLKLPRKKKLVFFADFALQNMVETTLPDGLETSGRRVYR